MMDDDKTVIIYSGGKEEHGTEVSGFSTPLPMEKEDHLPRVLPSFSVPFLNTAYGQPFLSALRSLYREVYLLERGKSHNDIHALKRKLIDLMDHHTRLFSEQGIENTHILIARYIISTFIDEHLGAIEWSQGETWANHSLLGHYYQETYGGEKFFQLLDQFAREPGKYIQHMKLIYACLSLGYKGKYTLSDNTDGHLESIRQELYRRIVNHQTEEERFYKAHPSSAKKNKLTLHVPYKMFLVSVTLILAIVYGVFTSMTLENENRLIDILQEENATTQKDTNGSI